MAEKSDITKILCASPKCPKHVSAKSKTGKRVYCSIRCYHEFSPKKRDLVLRWFPKCRREETADQFIEIFMYVQGQFRDIVDRVSALGISKSSYKFWAADVKKELEERKNSGKPFKFFRLL